MQQLRLKLVLTHDASTAGSGFICCAVTPAMEIYNSSMDRSPEFLSQILTHVTLMLQTPPTEHVPAEPLTFPLLTPAALSSTMMTSLFMCPQVKILLLSSLTVNLVATPVSFSLQHSPDS